jgi:hypothetical protein
MNLIALLTAVVLGLLTFAAKTSFDTKDMEWKHASANIVLLDRALAHYGPEAVAARDLLKAAVSRKLAQLESRPAGQSSSAGGPLVAEIEEVQDAVRNFSPTTDAQRLVKSRALDIGGDIAKARWFLIENVDSTVPLAFLAVLVFWLAFIFFPLWPLRGEKCHGHHRSRSLCSIACRIRLSHLRDGQLHAGADLDFDGTAQKGF